MSQNQQRHQNSLHKFRRRMGLSQRRVAKLLGQKSGSQVSGYERDKGLPTLTTALRLEIILRTPVAFLFPGLYEQLRKQIRAEEERMAGFGQQALLPHH